MTSKQKNICSKVELLYSQIRGKIMSGELKPKDKLMPERKIAEEYQVSRLIVREALSSLGNNGLITRIQGSGNYVSEGALLDSQAKNSVTLLYPVRKGININSDPYYLQLAEGINRQLENSGRPQLLKLCPLKPEQELSARIPASHWSEEFSGGLLLHTELLSTNDMQALLSYGIKMVSVGYPANEYEIPFVDIDNISGVKNAVTHLVELGHQEIVFINGPDELLYCESRAIGFELKMQQYGIKIKPELCLESKPWSAEKAYAQVSRLIKKKINFSAVIVGGDRAGMGCIKALHEAGIKIPDDVSVVVYDDNPDFFNWSNPPITAIAQPIFKLGEECAKMLQNLNSQKKVKQISKIIQPDLIIRKSTISYS